MRGWAFRYLATNAKSGRTGRTGTSVGLSASSASTNPAESDLLPRPRRFQFLAAVKTEPPPAVALPSVGPVLTAAARGAPLNPGRDGETVLRSNKETGS